MPKSRHTSVIVSPSNSRATNRRRSSITELAFHGINTSRPQKAKSVTHVSGTKCHPCLEPLIHKNRKLHGISGKPFFAVRFVQRWCDNGQTPPGVAPPPDRSACRF